MKTLLILNEKNYKARQANFEHKMPKKSSFSLENQFRECVQSLCFHNVSNLWRKA